MLGIHWDIMDKKCAGFTEKHAIKPTELVGDEALEDRCCILEQTHVAVSQQKMGVVGLPISKKLPPTWLAVSSCGSNKHL